MWASMPRDVREAVRMRVKNCLSPAPANSRPRRPFRRLSPTPKVSFGTSSLLSTRTPYPSIVWLASPSNMHAQLYLKALHTRSDSEGLVAASVVKTKRAQSPNGHERCPARPSQRYEHLAALR